MMNSKNLIDKYKYHKIQNNLIKNHKLRSAESSPKLEMEIPTKSNQYEYFPIESEKSKVEGNTIYLVTEESFPNNHPKIFNETQIEYENKQIGLDSLDMLNQNNNFFKQRSIEFQVNNQKLAKNNMGIYENKNNRNNNIFDNNYDFDVNYKDIPNDIDNKGNNININLNINPNNIDSFNNLNSNQNQINEDDKDVYKINNYKKIFDNKKTPMYVKKIKLNNKKIKNKENSEKNLKTKSEIFNKFNEIQKGRNTPKVIKEYIRKDEKISLTEGKRKEGENSDKKYEKNSISINNSLQDIFTTTNFGGILNRSLDEINLNLDSLYKSLDFAKNNIFDDLNNSKIMEKKFLNGMKNQDRRDSLKKAMDRYNMFRAFGKFRKNIFLNNSFHLEMDRKSELESEIKEENKNEIKENINNNNKEINNEEIIKEENKITEEENENEFSFNSEIKKFEKKNKLEKDNNNIKQDVKTNINNNDNENKNDLIIKEEEKIEKENPDKKEIEKELKLPEIQKEINKKGINNGKVDIPIIQNEKEKNIIDNKDKIFTNQEVKFSNENEEKKQEEKILNKNDNNGNIINNSINININNESLSKKNMNNENKYIPINKIKYKSNLKPGYFIRKVVREEHYYVDENGKEKILEVKQKFINNEDKKKMKINHPYKKKYVNLGNFFNNNNTSFNSVIIKDHEDIKFNNEINKKMNTIYKNNESFDEKEYKINIGEKMIKKNIYSIPKKINENRPVPILTQPHEIYNKNYNLKENENNYFNNNTYYNNTTELNNSKTLYSSKLLETKDNTNNESTLKYNQMRENRNTFNLNNNSRSLNISNKPKLTKHNTSKISSIIITKAKILDNKTHIIKPKIKNDYLNNCLYTTKALNNSNIHYNSNTIGHVDTIDRSFTNQNTVNTVNTLNNIDSYIKVNKMDNFKRLNTEQNFKKLKKININKESINPTIINNRKRESSKNHAYREINLTNINKAKNKLASNSLSHYNQTENNDELNTSHNTNKFSTITNNSERNNILKYSINSFNQNSRKIIDINKDKTYSNKNSTSSLFPSHRIINRFINIKTDKNQTELNSSNNRINHNYYESKSTKKEQKFNYIYNDNKRKIDNQKENNRNKYGNLNNREKKDQFFYSYYNKSNNNNNNNNYLTDKKFNRTSQFYH